MKNHQSTLQFLMKNGWLLYRWDDSPEEFHSAQEAIDWAEENNIKFDPSERANIYHSEDDQMDALISHRAPDRSIEDVRYIREKLKEKRV